ncbi:MAG TPA: family 16 glycoside hydrolase [Planctomicrobium sp.]|nr:family 16 glycoside hydrolase [Planctomicrobium sp.]
MSFPRVLLWSTRPLVASTAIAASLTASLSGAVIANAADQIIQAGSPRSTAALENETGTTEVIPVAAAVTETPVLAPSVPEFIPLIKGKELDGWVVQEGKLSAWTREGDTISCTSAAGGWLRTEAEYSDFELKLEYRLQAGGNTGIGLRAPATGNPTFTGIEIQLLDDESPKYTGLRDDQYTGSLYYQVPASKRAVLKPVGEWNQCEVRCLGDQLTIKINDEVVNEVTLNRRNNDAVGSEQPKPRYSLAQRPPVGHIALQSHSTRVDFRKIELKDLTVHTDSGLQYVDLKNGDGDEVKNPRTVTVHYVGQLLDGKRFTDTRDAGTPITVALASVIPGWQEGIQGMKVGGRRRLIVPSTLAYGTAGIADVIPADSTLVFEIELCGFEKGE